MLQIYRVKEDDEEDIYGVMKVIDTTRKIMRNNMFKHIFKSFAENNYSSNKVDNSNKDCSNNLAKEISQRIMIKPLPCSLNPSPNSASSKDEFGKKQAVPPSNDEEAKHHSGVTLEQALGANDYFSHGLDGFEDDEGEDPENEKRSEDDKPVGKTNELATDDLHLIGGVKPTPHRPLLHANPMKLFNDPSSTSQCDHLSEIGEMSCENSDRGSVKASCESLDIKQFNIEEDLAENNPDSGQKSLNQKRGEFSKQASQEANDEARGSFSKHMPVPKIVQFNFKKK